MITYKKTNGRAHDLRLVPEDYQAQGGEILLVGTELPSLDSLHDSPLPGPTPQEKIKQLEHIEGEGVYVRGVREFMLGIAEGLAAINPQLSQQMLATPGLRKVKALDDAIKALRAQIKP